MRAAAPRRPAAAPSLRATWYRAVVQLIAILAAVGLLTLTTTHLHQTRYAGTTVELQVSTEALLDLEQELVDSWDPMFGTLYRFGGDEERYERAVAGYDQARRRVIAAWDAAVAVTQDGIGDDEMAQARDYWLAADAAVLESAELYSVDDLIRFYFEDHDPYAETVWANLEASGEALRRVRRDTVTELSEVVEGAQRTQRLVAPTVVLALALALALALLTATRVNRRVIAPLAELGREAHSLQDLRHHPQLDVPKAVAEVQALASILSEASSTLRSHHQALRTQALTDTLTSLPNRDAFGDALREMLDDPHRSRIAVLFIDLDDFKHVNDTMGHAAGDQVLRYVGQRLSTSTRRCEIAARLGGDEFAVLIDASADPEAPSHVARRIRHSLAAAIDVGGRAVQIGCSIGIVVSETGATAADADELLGNADFAMYMAKSRGKGCDEVYSPALHTEVLARMELASDLDHALNRDQLVLHYQPLLDLDSTGLLGFEALVRWQHPARGLVPPLDFIGLAEASGAIIGIGTWVLDQACGMLARHRPITDDLVMSVNVSPRQLEDPRLADTVLEAVERHGIRPGELMLEITEATAMTSTEQAIATISRLREHGIHIALDDFGTGYSSLRSLGDLPVDVIKVDRSFVAGRGDHHVSTLETMTTLARRLDLHVVAEGIETDDDLDRLRKLGSMAGQGYLFSRPVPEAEAVEFTQQHAPAAPRFHRATTSSS